MPAGEMGSGRRRHGSRRPRAACRYSPVRPAAACGGCGSSGWARARCCWPGWS